MMKNAEERWEAFTRRPLPLNRAPSDKKCIFYRKGRDLGAGNAAMREPPHAVFG
jgi:hypothetical protein